MKKSLAKACVLALTSVMALTGCAGPSTQGGPASTATQGKVKIEYWHVNAESQGGLSVDKLVKDFNAQSQTVEVVARYNPDMYKGLMQNLQAEAAAGKSPAIVQVGWSFLDYFAHNFAYTEPQTIIDAHFPQDKAFITDNFLPNITALAKNQAGKQVGLPYSLSSPVLYINRDILKAAGLPETGPKTWEEVISFSKAIKAKTGKFGLYVQEPSDTWAQQAILTSNGAQMLATQNGKTQATFASPEGIAAYDAYAKMVTEDKTALHMSWDEGVKTFVEGNTAMLYTTIARRASIQKTAKFDVAAIPSPAWNGKQKKVPAGGCFLAITAKSAAEQKAAWEFMRYLYSIEGMSEWTIGTGYVPPRKDVADSEKGLKKFLSENKMMEAAIGQMDSVVPWTSFPGDAGLKAEQILLDMRDQILSGRKKASEAMPEAQNMINSLLK